MDNLNDVSIIHLLEPYLFLIAWNNRQRVDCRVVPKMFTRGSRLGLPVNFCVDRPTSRSCHRGPAHTRVRRVYRNLQERTRCERQSIFSALATSLSKRRTPRSADSVADCFIVQHQRQPRRLFSDIVTPPNKALSNSCLGTFPVASYVFPGSVFHHGAYS